MSKISPNFLALYVACIVISLSACGHKKLGLNNTGSIVINIECPSHVFLGDLIYPKVMVENKSNRQLSEFSLVLTIDGKKIQSVKILNGPSPGGKDIVSRDGGFKMDKVGNIKLEAVALNEDGIVDAQTINYVNVAGGSR